VPASRIAPAMIAPGTRMDASMSGTGDAARRGRASRRMSHRIGGAGGDQVNLGLPAAHGAASQLGPG